jgi:cellulose synthase/poly-beta-1,6-N-acetylglucosamine synthase-like glycosyltransferase
MAARLGACRRRLPHDTLVEDQDMTLTILQAGYKIIYEPKGIAYTETPPDVNRFMKQRFRWVYGTVQCFWKHKRVFIERPLSPMSLLVMPNILSLRDPSPAYLPYRGHYLGVWAYLQQLECACDADTRPSP